MSDEEQTLRVRLVGRDGRRRYDPASKARLVAACLEPGVSISGMALAHGINANVLRKWVKDSREAGLSAAPVRSAFIPVIAADCGKPVGARSLDMAVAGGEDQAASVERTAVLQGSSKIRALLPNGVKLSLECGDVDALTAIIGALGRVQAVPCSD
ncbi:IS66-like element accessory protein TnpA [Rhizobium sp. SL86]|uniref:IS66-like element accessory protein TnpA n=1 Tax=Rhizobium sp. SL86 TaxID=2995148 RepID=UPI002274E8CA|nr:transposase [Rhizobium sp. SL86]MCY1669016.1 transposase [Rhizobium sp. SL86]